jgi:ABC-type uncharacterized transport system ATPase subunit
MSVRDNLNLRRFDRNKAGSPRTWLDRTDMADWACRMIATFGIKAPSDQVLISTLSGGNVQRTVLARELDGTVALLVVSNPCSGLDVKAVSEIRARIMAARNAGTAILLLSEDLDEILELSDRISSCARVRSSTRPPAPAATRERSAAIWWGGCEMRPSLAIHLIHNGEWLSGQTRSVTFCNRAGATPSPHTGGTASMLTQPRRRKCSS